MTFLGGYFVAAFFLSSSAFATTSAATLPHEIVFVQSIWRHGDRAPEFFIKTDKANGPESWPTGAGQLTTKGMIQHFLLGRKLRARYAEELGLVSKIYKSGEVYIRSSDSDRTLMSASSNMVGFYASDKEVQRFNEQNQYLGNDTAVLSHSSVREDGAHGGVRTQKDAESYWPLVKGWPGHFVPVPIHTVARESDQLPNVDASCRRQTKLDKFIEETPPFKQLANETHDFLEEFSKNCSEEVNLQNIWRFEGAIVVDEFYNRTLPTWLTKEVREKVHQIDTAVIELYYGINATVINGVNIPREVLRLRSGPLLSAIVDNLKQKIDCLKEENTVLGKLKPGQNCAKMNPLKYYAFSMHDVTLRALYLGLGLKNVTGISGTENPSYATAFTLELWRRRAQNGSDEDKYFIKLLYWPANRTIYDKVLYEDITDRISECDKVEGGSCSYLKFVERSDTYRPKPNIDALCANENLLHSSTISARHFGGFSLSIFTIFVVFVGNFLKICHFM